MYARSRKAAESEAARKYLAAADRRTYRKHPLSLTKAITVEMTYDDEARSFVTFVKELHRMSTFGDTEEQALDRTAEMIRGYIKTMEAHRKKIPLSPAKLDEVKRIVGLI